MLALVRAECQPQTGDAHGKDQLEVCAMLSERRLEVLRAIVQDYVGTEEPVGSKALTERHSLGVSPATVRNDMAALEDEGYIAQPHALRHARPRVDQERRPLADHQADRAVPHGKTAPPDSGCQLLPP